MDMRLWSRLAAFGILGLLTGCTAARGVVDPVVTKVRVRDAAKSAWERDEELYADYAEIEHLEAGYRAGYERFVFTMRPDAPLSPPKRYQQPWYRTCFGRHELGAWYDGWAIGVEAAAADCASGIRPGDDDVWEDDSDGHRWCFEEELEFGPRGGCRTGRPSGCATCGVAVVGHSGCTTCGGMAIGSPGCATCGGGVHHAHHFSPDGTCADGSCGTGDVFPSHAVYSSGAGFPSNMIVEGYVPEGATVVEDAPPQVPGELAPLPREVPFKSAPQLKTPPPAAPTDSPLPSPPPGTAIQPQSHDAASRGPRSRAVEGWRSSASAPPASSDVNEFEDAGPAFFNP